LGKDTGGKVSKGKKEYKLTPLQKLIYILALILIIYGFWKLEIAQQTKLIIIGATLIFYTATYILIVKKPLAGSIITALFIIYVISMMYFSQYIFTVLRNVGIIKIVYPPGGAPPSGEFGIGVYEDPDASVPLTQIDWGEITPASVVSVYRNVYIKNIGQKDCKLSMQTENWKPSEASKHMWLSWSYNNLPLRRGNITLITFGLHVNSSIVSTGITNFSFDIVIYVEEAT
jgi:hypothetical protein